MSADGLSRRLAHVERLQHAQAQRPDLVLRRSTTTSRAGRRRPSTCSTGTRIPRACRPANHSFYLRNCYLDNTLSKGEMVIGGKTLDLEAVKIPVYNLATREDHIAPAPFRLPRLAMLRRAGRACGVGLRATSPASSIRRARRNTSTGPAGRPRAPTRPGWRRLRNIPAPGGRTGSPGSKPGAPKKVAAREPGGGKLEPLADAPRTYVKVKA